MSRGQFNILLVDQHEQDHATIRDLLAGLDHWQFNLDWVTSYEAALTKIEQVHQDICLLDWDGDGSRGLDFVEQAVKTDSSMSLILMTGAADQRLAMAALEAGAVDYMVREQLDGSLLVRSIYHAVRHQQQQDAIESRVRKRTAELTVKIEQLQQEAAEYKKKAARLHESEEQYRALFDIDIYSVEVLDKDGKIVDCNTTYQHLLGYEREEIIGRPSADFATPRSKQIIEKKLALLAEQGYVEGEVELARQDGSTILVWRRSRATYNESGTFIGAVAYSRDITERMKAVRQISTLARALEQSPLAIMILDVAGTIEYANLEFTELTGYAFEDIAGQNLRSLDLGQSSTQIYDDIWRSLKTDNEWQGELNSRRQNGESYWESVTISPMFNERGILTHFIVIREDITARREAETELLDSQNRIGSLMTEHINDLTTSNEALQHEISERTRAERALKQSQARLRAQYKGIPIPTYTWQRAGKDFVLADFNHMAEKTTNGRIADLRGKGASQIFKDRPQVMADLWRSFSERTLVKREAPYRLVATGETRYFETTYNYIRPNLVIVHIQDTTETKQTEKELEQCRAQLKTGSTVQSAELAKVKEELIREMMRREEAEQALKKSGERLKEVVDNIDDRLREQYRSIPIPTYSWQMIAGEFILVDFNDAAAESMGKIVDLLGKPASEIFEERPQVLADFSHAYNEKTKVIREAPYTLVTTGETRYFVTTYHYVPPNLVIDHIQDITEYKQIEAELEKYREQFKAAGSNGPHPPDDALQQEIARREKADRLRAELQTELEKFRDSLEQLITEQTTGVNEVTKHLEQELRKYEREVQSLRQSRGKLRTLYKGIPIPTYAWQRVGKDFMLVDYNDAAEKSTKGRIVDFSGKSTSEVFKERDQVLADFARCYDEKATVVREAPYKLVTTGETRYFVTTYNYVPPNLVICYIKDITEQRKIEEAMQSGLDQVELVCRFSPDMKLAFVNEAYCAYYKLSREKLLGRYLPFVYDGDAKLVKQHFAALSQERPVGIIEHRVVKSRGDVRWLRWLNRVVFDSQGQPLEFWSVGQDITRSKEAAS